MARVHTGIPGVGDIDVGTHLCAFYSGPAERDRLLVPFLQEGLREGDQCVCVTDGSQPQDMLDRLGRLGRRSEGEAHIPSEKLKVERAASVYVRAGRFSVEHMTAFLADSATVAEGHDSGRMRATGEMSWALPGPPGAHDFFVYESAINRLVAQVPALLMFMYDLKLFGVSMLADVLKTHPTVLLDSAVLTNRNYLTPQEYLATRRPLTPAEQALVAQAPMPASHAVDVPPGAADLPTDGQEHYALATNPPGRRPPVGACDGWESLTQAEHRIALLVAGGLSNKLIAERLTLSRHTVDAHLKHTFIKLTIHSRVELTVLALKHRGSPTMHDRTDRPRHSK
jgi:DNA-binding CsgD family transcriptional regulator